MLLGPIMVNGLMDLTDFSDSTLHMAPVSISSLFIGTQTDIVHNTLINNLMQVMHIMFIIFIVLMFIISVIVRIINGSYSASAKRTTVISSGTPHVSVWFV